MKSHKLALSLIIALGFIASPIYAEKTSTNKTETTAVAASSVQLMKGDWDSFNLQELNGLIAKYGKANPKYDPNNKPYAVFDWDNTSVFLDIQEALFIYQIENLVFNLTPEELDHILRLNVPTVDFTEEDNNLDGQPVNIDKVAKDIVSSYTWIYNNYDGMKGKVALADIHKTEQYKEFSTKLRYLYSAIGNSFDASLSYPWVTYLFSGLKQDDIAKMTANTVEWQQYQPVEDVTWTSPDIKSEAGKIAITWHNGLRLVPEMQDLYTKLRDAGIDIWVCSASFIDVIKEISSNPKFGYNNPVGNVIAMELERDENGVIKPIYRKGYNQTQGPGKTVEINRLIAPKYGNRGPILVAGDSEGDQNMMQDFKETDKVIIINRLRKATTDIGQFSKEAVGTYQKDNAKFLLQGRNENTGLYTQSQNTVPLGQKEGKALRD